jgi:hypothetical protein
MSPVLLDCQLLRTRAAQCRHLAGEMRDHQIGDRLMLLAKEYEEMAANEERKVGAPTGWTERVHSRDRGQRS